MFKCHAGYDANHRRSLSNTPGFSIREHQKEVQRRPLSFLRERECVKEANVVFNMPHPVNSITT